MADERGRADWVVRWPVQQEDIDRFGIDQDDSTHQQLLEALAALVALRLWKQIWQQDRIMLDVRSDNMTTLAMISRMKAKIPSLRIVAAEMALLLADSAHMPWVVEHTLGIQNLVADICSRKFEPGFAFHLPAALSETTCCTPPARGELWYRTLRTPGQRRRRGLTRDLSA